MTLRSDLIFKAKILSRIRSYFESRGAVEVHTPTLLETTVAHPTTRVFQTLTVVPDPPRSLYLQPSPELAMRELIAAGSGEIFQICKAYRDEEADATHSREFILVEWYAPNTGYLEMAEAVCSLVDEIARRPVRRLSCDDIFLSTFGVAVHQLSLDDLQAIHARFLGDDRSATQVPGVLFDALLGHAVRTIADDCILCIVDYPQIDPCFARLASGGHVERFEILLDGIEIANGYQEIESGSDFVTRFNVENEQRRLLGHPPLPEISVADIESCSGVAIGLERIFSVVQGTRIF